jgi:hypothetical protein
MGYLQNWLTIIIISAIVGFYNLPRIIDGFSSPETICRKCLENLKYKYRVGAICKYGWRSTATGSGACSHHSRVMEWIYEEVYRKAQTECKEYEKKNDLGLNETEKG